VNERAGELLVADGGKSGIVSNGLAVLQPQPLIACGPAQYFKGPQAGRILERLQQKRAVALDVLHAIRVQPAQSGFVGCIEVGESAD
jgi:hypothetical protein